MEKILQLYFHTLEAFWVKICSAIILYTLAGPFYAEISPVNDYTRLYSSHVLNFMQQCDIHVHLCKYWLLYLYTFVHVTVNQEPRPGTHGDRTTACVCKVCMTLYTYILSAIVLMLHVGCGGGVRPPPTYSIAYYEHNGRRGVFRLYSMPGTVCSPGQYVASLVQANVSYCSRLPGRLTIIQKQPLFWMRTLQSWPLPVYRYLRGKPSVTFNSMPLAGAPACRLLCRRLLSKVPCRQCGKSCLGLHTSSRGGGGSRGWYNHTTMILTTPEQLYMGKT